MKKLLYCLFAAAFALGCSSDDDKATPTDPDDIILQPCANAIIVQLNTQEDVVNLAANEYCSVGELKIGSGDVPSTITDLTPLATLLNVEGNITILSNPQLTSLEGLHNIINAKGDLIIAGNTALTSLDGLRGLKTLGGDVSIHANTALSNGNGLKNMVTKEDATISIGHNGALTALSLEGVVKAERIDLHNTLLQNLSCLKNLTGVQVMTLNENAALTSLNGLGALKTINTLYITNSPALTSIEGIGGITAINELEISSTVAFNDLEPLQNITTARSIKLTDNQALTSLDGLGGLTAVGIISLQHNPQLTSLSALSNLKEIKVMDATQTLTGLVVLDNDTLVTLNGLQGVTSFKGTLYISENASLKDFCAIQNIIDNGDYEDFFTSIDNNQYTPDFTVPGGCSMD